MIHIPVKSRIWTEFSKYSVLHYLLGWLNTPLIPSSKYFLCKGVLSIQSSITCSYQYKLKTHRIFWNFHCIYSVWYTLAIYIKVKRHTWERMNLLIFAFLFCITAKYYKGNIYQWPKYIPFLFEKRIVCDVLQFVSSTFYVQNWMKVPTVPHFKKCCIFLVIFW